VNFQRGLRFNKTYQFTVSAKLTSFSITVIARLSCGTIGLGHRHHDRECAAVILSYAMEPHRRASRFSKIRDISSFSIWNLAKSIGGYLYRHLEKPLIGNFAGAPRWAAIAWPMT